MHAGIELEVVSVLVRRCRLADPWRLIEKLHVLADYLRAQQFLGDLQDVVDAGEDAFDDSAEGVLLGGAVNFVSAMAAAECDPGFGA